VSTSNSAETGIAPTPCGNRTELPINRATIFQ
jgi:hypothetical protein